MHQPITPRFRPLSSGPRGVRAGLAAALVAGTASCASTPDPEPRENAADGAAAEEGASASSSEADGGEDNGKVLEAITNRRIDWSKVKLSPAAGASDAPEATTRYRLGDYVVYRYSGAFSKQPVTLTEEIIKQEGLLLEIEVRASRGTESMTWVQVVTDTPENQKNEVIDALYEVKDGARVKLANEKNADIYRLYAWTLPPDLHPTGKGGRVEESLAFAGASFACTRQIGTGKVDEQSVRYSFASCPDFLWTNGPASIVSEAGLEIWTREVVEMGSRAAK